jgi:hypothetical protein
MQIIAAIAMVIGLISSFVDLIGKKVLGRPILNRKTLYVFLYVGTLALGLFLGSLSGWYGEKQTPFFGGQNQISSLERTIDFLKGKTGKLNQKIDEYEGKLNIPRKGRIILFDHINYKGHRCYLTLEDDVSDLNLYGFGNTVSSIKVEEGARAKIYSGIDYTGASWLIESDMPSLVDNNWNDRILSISMEEKEEH